MSMTRKTIVILTGIVLLLCGSAAYMVYAKNSDTASDSQSVSSPPQSPNDKPTESPIPGGKVITVEGVIVCLSPKDTSGPHDLSCAIGLKQDNGTSYALGSDDPTITGGIPTGQRVRVTGTFTEQTTSYDMLGLLKVSTIERL